MNAQIATDTKQVDARSFAFERCLELLVAGRSQQSPFKSRIKSQRSQDHTGWPKGVTIQWEVEDRDRAHRPTISDETMEEFPRLVKQEWPSVPVEDLDFDDQLRLMIKRRHEWLHALSGDFILHNTTTDEKAKLTSGGSGLL